MATLLLEVQSGIGAPVHTEIAGDKKIIRKRVWVGEFFRVNAGAQIPPSTNGRITPIRAIGEAWRFVHDAAQDAGSRQLLVAQFKQGLES